MSRVLEPVTVTPAPQLGPEHYTIRADTGERLDAPAADDAASAVRAEVLTADVFARRMGVKLNDAGEITRAWVVEGPL